jgi:DNA-binding protein H-NS
MPDIDLREFSFAELQKLKEDIDQEITRRQTEEVRRVRKEIMHLAQSVGMSIEELIKPEVERGRAKPEGAPKYVNPDDPSQTWTGRGPRPRWVREALQAGKSLEELRA